jgi:hypothetical protein
VIDYYLIVFFILLYLNLKIISANSRTGRDRSLAESKPVMYIYMGSLPVFSLLILGFLIMKWYLFLPLAIFLMIDPLVLLLGRNHAQTTMTYVFKNYLICIVYMVLSSIGLWLYYLLEIKRLL